MATNTNGLIYYKLDANLHGFPGDITKNCGLRGEEIDGNFNFLRGNDIKSIQFDEKGTMYLTKYNGEILTAKQTETPEYDFNYNPDSGSLTIVTPDGKEIVLSGFKIVTNVYHDYSMEGYGSPEYPLGISNQAKTGRYQPAIKLIDTTLEDDNGQRLESLPMENNTKHDRYVTKEAISRFGRLFPLRGVEQITERLTKINSEWHVPTKEEWDELLNVVDKTKPNHSQTDSNVELGEFAGTLLKSVKYWEKADSGKLLSEDTYGFSVYPVGYCGNRGKQYYGSFGLASAFWTATVEDNNKDMYVKTFDNNKETVGQRTWGENYYLSLRLVKKFTGDNFSDAEDIDGFTSNCLHIPGSDLIWTKNNIAFSQEQYDGYAPAEWKNYEAYDDVRYFINDWNGDGWDKHEIKEGEGIILFEGTNGKMHEWVLIDGELVDTAVFNQEELTKQFDEVYQHINDETNARIEADAQLQNALNDEITARQTADEKLNNALNDEITARQDGDNQIWEALNSESTNRENDSDRLQQQIDKNKVVAADASVVIVDGTSWGKQDHEADVQKAQKQLEEMTTNLASWSSDNKLTPIELSLLNEEYEYIKSEYPVIIERARKYGLQTTENWEYFLQSYLMTTRTLTYYLNAERDEFGCVAIIKGNGSYKDYDNIISYYMDRQYLLQDITSKIGDEDETIPTTIKVNLDSECNHLKLGENGVYFDGYFGQF